MKLTLPKQSNRFFRKFVLLGFFLFALLAFAFTNNQAFAVNGQNISASPTHSTDTDPRTRSWFIYTLPAGEVRTDSVTVTNHSATAVTVKVYPVDSVTASGGGFGLANEADPKKGIGAWVKLSVSEVTLNPGEVKNIPFTISIPANAVRGDYSGGIIFQETTSQKIDYKGMGINLISRIGVRIYETVPGNEQLSVVVNNLHYTVVNNYLTFTFTAENKGTVHIAPTGVLEIKDIIGRQVGRVTLDPMLDTLVPGKPVTITIPTQILSPILGFDTANVVLYYSPTLAASQSIMVLPTIWTMFGVILIILLIIAYIVFKKYSKQGKGKEHIAKIAPRMKVLIGVILAGIILFSWFVSYLLNFLFVK